MWITACSTSVTVIEFPFNKGAKKKCTIHNGSFLHFALTNDLLWRIKPCDFVWFNVIILPFIVFIYTCSTSQIKGSAKGPQMHWWRCGYFNWKSTWKSRSIKLCYRVPCWDKAAVLKVKIMNSMHYVHRIFKLQTFKLKVLGWEIDWNIAKRCSSFDESLYTAPVIDNYKSKFK